MNAKMRAVEKRINGVKGKILVQQYLATVYDFTCKYCGKEFESTNKKRKFCCVKCYRKWHTENDRVRYKKTCPICNKEFETIHPQAICCSIECSKKRRKILILKEKKCKHC
jgi:hypothetical protein